MASTLDELVAEGRRNQQRLAIVHWTEEEWDELALKVWTARKKDPSKSVMRLLKAAQSQFKKDRQRDKISSCEPLLRRLKARDQLAADALEKVGHVNELLHGPETRREVIRTLTDEELAALRLRVLPFLAIADLFNHFQPATLLEALPVEQIVGLAATRLVMEIQEIAKVAAMPVALLEVLRTHANGHHTNGQPQPVKPKIRLPKLLFVGMKPSWPQQVRNRLVEKASLEFLSANDLAHATKVPEADHVIVWASFVNGRNLSALTQQVPRDRLVKVNGGLSQIITAAEAALCKTETPSTKPR